MQRLKELFGSVRRSPVAVGAGLVALSGASFAQDTGSSIDTSSVTTWVTAALAAIAVIGAARLGVRAAGSVWGWITRVVG